MRIAIVGSPQWKDSDIIRGALGRLIARRGHFEVRVLGDGAVATIAGAYCRLQGLPVELTGRKNSRARRGREMESPLADVDMIVAFWNGVSEETAAILLAAQDAGLNAWVIRPDGGRYKHS